MNDRFQVIILPRALDDMIELATFIQQQSAQNASLVTDVLLKAIDSLERFPYRCKVHQHRRNSALTVRAMSVSSFIVYYRVDQPNRTVRVLCVRRGARRPPKRF